MLRPNGFILVGDLEIPYFQELEINTSRNNITDTAKFSFPNRINATGGKITDQIQIGQPVRILLGYYPNLQLEFEGYVSAIIPDRTATIECEDEAYIYKRQSIKQGFILKDTTTTELISRIYTGSATVFDAKIGDWKVGQGATIVDVLDELKKKFSLFSYWRNQRLVVGGALGEQDGGEVGVTVDFQGNVPEGESNLDIKNAVSSGNAVKGQVLKRDGTFILVYAYYDQESNIVFGSEAPDGSVVSEINVGEAEKITEADVQSLCARKLAAISNSGINGSVVIYGEPSATHGGDAILRDRTRSDDIDGTYRIVGVIKKFTQTGGYRQELKLGAKLN